MSLFPKESEWHLGWRIVGAAAIANATGISLLFYCFSMLMKPMEADFGLTRGEAGVAQATVIMAAFGAPIIGRLVDRTGFRLMFLTCTLAMAAVELSVARWGYGFGAMAMATAAIGFIGGGSSTVLLTRPITAHFRQYRGLALGMVGVGISLSTIFVPPWLEHIVAEQGWRQGYLTLAAIAVTIGLPIALLLMPARVSVAGASAQGSKIDWNFLRCRDFWLITAAAVIANVATSGAIGQLSPMLQDSGLSPSEAAKGLSAFAIGQFIGKLGGGWLLDRHEPRLVAAVLTALPSVSFLLFLNIGPDMPLLLFATALLGLLQGADVSIFSFFIARRFPLEQYGTVFGVMHGLGWIGTAAGLIGFGVSFDFWHSYRFAQIASIALLVIGASIIPLIRLPARDQS